ncbi:hypothetical protein EXIGLDRAFT_719492 [Exidia glandulosa HHB12029]|uniref:DUF6534 domain-containing protein n=1 Tax=Exidia glandulosa HHB12029 TaxID=1314781 RepID=A0A165NRA5_EXIGL|nr:hypothetical protein EXIGLDRAFT_719492 [Exidia glandulosa HHB12029]
MASPALVAAPPPEEVIVMTWGPYVTGIMLQQLFMGVFVVQLYDYFRMFQKDPLYIKGLVAALATATTLQAIMDYLTLYRCAVRFYGDFDKFDDTDWSLWWEIAMTAIIGTIAQSFFLTRCWSAVKSKIIVVVGGAAIITSLIAGIDSTVQFQNIRRLSLVPNIPVPITLWLSATAVIDVGIAVVLVVALIRMKTPFRKTEAIITKMIRVTMETSSLTAATAVVNLVLYLALPGEAYHLLPQLVMGKFYAISVMVTLASRKELRDIIEQAEYASYITSTMAGSNKTAPTGIKVTTTTTVGEPNADIELGNVDHKHHHLQPTHSEEDMGYDQKGQI